MFEFFFVKVEDEDFVPFLEKMSGEAAADALGSWTESVGVEVKGMGMVGDLRRRECSSVEERQLQGLSV